MSLPDNDGGYVAPGVARRLARRLVPFSLREDIRLGVLDTAGLSEAFTYLDPARRARRVRAADIVIEGSARSANTYAKVAFEYANGGRYVVASHFHVARPVQLGLELGLPVIVLVRDPADVLASTLQFTPRGDARHILRVYSRFYRRILPLVGDVVLADFDEVTEDFGGVIKRCNARFGTEFAVYEKTDEAEAAVREHIERLTGLVVGDQAEQLVSLPTSSRLASEHVLERLDPRSRDALSEARALYGEVLARRVP